MKIYNSENGEKVLYIQTNDIKRLFDLNIDIPIYIYNSYFKYMYEENNTKEFVRITNPSEIQFFSSLDYVVDLNLISSLTFEDLNKFDERVRELYKKLFVRYTEVRIEKNPDKIKKIKFELDRMTYITEEIVNAKSLLTTLSINLLPLVESGYSNELSIGNGTPYTVHEGLTNKVLIIRRRDNEPIDYEDLDFNVIYDILLDSFASFFFDYKLEEIKEDNRLILVMKIKTMDVFEHGSNEVIRRTKRTY